MAISLRGDFDATQVRRAARASQDANQVRRLLALAAIDLLRETGSFLVRVFHGKFPGLG